MAQRRVDMTKEELATSILSMIGQKTYFLGSGKKTNEAALRNDLAAVGIEAHMGDIAEALNVLTETKMIVLTAHSGSEFQGLLVFIPVKSGKIEPQPYLAG